MENGASASHSAERSRLAEYAALFAVPDHDSSEQVRGFAFQAFGKLHKRSERWLILGGLYARDEQRTKIAAMGQLFLADGQFRSARFDLGGERS
jgi:hypothetical protein